MRASRFVVGMGTVLLLCASGRTSRGADAPSPAAPAKPAKPPKVVLRDLSAGLRGIRETHGVPGIAAAVVRGGTVVALGADGVRKAGAEPLVTTEDLWHLGSCTKAMTATLCGLLAEDGTLPFSTTLAEGFPDLAKTFADGWSGVRLEWLLQNRGGAPSNLDADGLWARLWSFEGTSVAARRALLEGVVRRPPVEPPGTKFHYSNAGYAIAGALAETKTGVAWEDLVARRVFTPLGITTAGFGAPGRAGATDQPWGHRTDGTPVEPGPGSDNPPAIAPAGTVHMSIADWGKFVALHLEAARGRPRLASKATFARLHEAAPDGEYAMGWRVTERPWAKGRVLTHAGSNTMWFCVAWIAPNVDLALLVCANRGGDAGAAATDAVAASLIGPALEMPGPASAK